MNSRNLFFIGSQSVSDLRMTLAATRLKEAGHNAEFELYKVPYFLLSIFDAFIVGRPNGSMCEFCRVAMDAGKVVLIDMDDDFRRIPKDHPGYKILGPGARAREDAPEGSYLPELEKAMRFVTGLVTPSSVVGNKSGRLDYKIVPNP